MVRTLVIVAAGYAVVGLFFYVGCLNAGMSGATLSVVAVVVVAVLAASALAIKSAWVRK